jgi:Fe-S-cluster-containing dehydrogenase component
MTLGGPMVAPTIRPPSAVPARWIKVLDQSRCIGCHACTTACKSGNEVPLGVTRTSSRSTGR